MKAGLIDAMVVQNPYQMGYDGTRLMLAMIQDDKKTIKEMLPEWSGEGDKFNKPNGDIITTELRVVVPDDKSPVKKEILRPETKFFYYKDFQKWLDDRKLVSS
jgi:ribose transport system substrate-binding protein